LWAVVRGHPFLVFHPFSLLSPFFSLTLSSFMKNLTGLSLPFVCRLKDGPGHRCLITVILSLAPYTPWAPLSSFSACFSLEFFFQSCRCAPPPPSFTTSFFLLPPQMRSLLPERSGFYLPFLPFFFFPPCQPSLCLRASIVAAGLLASLPHNIRLLFCHEEPFLQLFCPSTSSHGDEVSFSPPQQALWVFRIVLPKRPPKVSPRRVARALH